MEYLDSKTVTAIRIKPLEHHKLGLQETATGYGSKLRTVYQVCIGKRWHRVYCVCCSNIGSLYVIQRGRKAFIGPETEWRLQDHEEQ